MLLNRAALEVYNPELRLSPWVLGVHHRKWPAGLPRYLYGTENAVPFLEDTLYSVFYTKTDYDVSCLAME